MSPKTEDSEDTDSVWQGSLAGAHPQFYMFGWTRPPHPRHRRAAAQQMDLLRLLTQAVPLSSLSPVGEEDQSQCERDGRPRREGAWRRTVGLSGLISSLELFPCV